VTRPDVCAVVLSAGEGTRLRPLTATLPKALCPVGNVPLLDRALTRLARHGLAGPEAVAVNVCYLADLVADHVGDRAYVSREPGPPALGTSGALYQLKDWTAGRGVLAVNADGYLAPADPGSLDLAPLLDGWDGRTVRVLAVPAGDRPVEFSAPDGSGYRFAGASLLPADLVAATPARPQRPRADRVASGRAGRAAGDLPVRRVVHGLRYADRLPGGEPARGCRGFPGRPGRDRDRNRGLLRGRLGSRGGRLDHPLRRPARCPRRPPRDPGRRRPPRRRDHLRLLTGAELVSGRTPS